MRASRRADIGSAIVNRGLKHYNTGAAPVWSGQKWDAHNGF